MPLVVSPLMILMSPIVYGTICNNGKIVLTGLVPRYFSRQPIIEKSIFRLAERPASKTDPMTLLRTDAIAEVSGILGEARSVDRVVYEWSDSGQVVGGI